LVSEFGLRGDETVHTVTLGGQATEETVRPGELVVRPGDIVEFVTVDRRVHTLRFPADSLGPAARDFLWSTEQDGSPPLVGQGSRFVVTFENAPPGRYPFVSRGYGEEACGTIIVRQND
jgi:plastocyanin